MMQKYGKLVKRVKCIIQNKFINFTLIPLKKKFLFTETYRRVIFSDENFVRNEQKKSFIDVMSFLNLMLARYLIYFQ